MLYRFSLLLTPPAERPSLPDTVPGYKGIHLYTATEIISTVIIFVVSLTKAAPVFPVLIVILVPIRLLVMKRLWNRETLRYVDAWACKGDGTPEDDEDAKLLSGDDKKGEKDHKQTTSSDPLGSGLRGPTPV